ncbi:MAG TPA: hypothetical protein PLJ58_03600, partial [bacterium]|nr:hypothetical protein [bacterium]
LDLVQMVTVRFNEVDDQGRINLTMKGQVENEALWKDEKGKGDRPATSDRGERPARRFERR